MIEKAQKARINKILDTKFNYSGTIMTRRERIHKLLESGNIPRIVYVTDEPATLKRDREIERVRKGWIPMGNPNHPETIKYNNLINDQKNNFWVKKPEYCIGDWIVTKTEYDYANEHLLRRRQGVPDDKRRSR